MDIGSGKVYPCGTLSNFAPHPFVIDGVQCNSMEGFVQSLKFKDPEMQRYVCTLVGRQAKYKGKGKPWYRDQTLYWQGVKYPRDSKEYQELLDRAYFELGKNPKFRKALEATRYSKLTHSIGKRKIKETVITERELCSRLENLREMYRKENIKKI